MAGRRAGQKSDGVAQATEVPEIAKRRGERLSAWLHEHEFKPAQFSRLSGISAAMLGNYIRGTTDIGKMGPSNITQLLDAMHVSDTWAWRFFEIPDEDRKSWRSTRPAPMGPPAEGMAHYTTHTIDSIVKGEWIISPPVLITVDPQERAGLLLAQVGKRYWLAEQDALPASAVILGQFRTAAPAVF
ncbi:hypothetical protein GO986_16400 [Deinococcus sp. HMF7620]|uniref:HTH cro/C1-type domain-containing protein n=1 Tax=Deinococcus arboris TaxID=2682977 RepID=A0A7C9HTG2_9DEIO|nr:helix-turn-helix transcriptional regulator [Deinococcus arboris]MVN88327.1 hypothetical protein [Deinococcus arboris]